MSMQKNDIDPAPPISAETVERYLRDHPEFFQTREALLAELSLPHPSGAAVSLIERQVALLREQNQRHHQQLQELLQIARDNDALIGRLQQLTLSLMDTARLGDILALLQRSLREDFHADAATLRLFATVDDPAALHDDRLDFLQAAVTDIDTLTDGLRGTLSAGRPVCGRLKHEPLHSLFSTAIGEIASAALLPLSTVGAGTPRLQGLLAIGSRTADRFTPEMGTNYLHYMGELISRRLAPHLIAGPDA